MRVIEGKMDGPRFPIGVIVSRFNEKVTSKLMEGAQTRLKELGFEPDEVTLVHVPGAVEIPIVAQKLAEQGRYRAIVALGCVIRGETTHYDYVCDQASQGCLRVSLKYDLPVVFGVLTTENAEQALSRAGGKKGHKGREAVDAAVEMVSVLSQLT